MPKKESHGFASHKTVWGTVSEAAVIAGDDSAPSRDAACMQCFLISKRCLRRQQVDKGSCAWAAVHVWGFQDAPVSWHGAMHGHGPMLGGENDYTVLLLPGGQYVLYVAAGEGDHFSSIGAPENT